MHVYEVTPGIYKIFSQIASLKTYSTGYFSKQKNESGYFCGMTLVCDKARQKFLIKFMLSSKHLPLLLPDLAISTTNYDYKFIIYDLSL